MDKNLDKFENINERKTTLSENISLKIRKGFFTNKTKTFLLIIIVVLAFIALNMWAQTKDLAQIDLTESKIYTLSQASKDAIKDIEDEVIIYLHGYDENSIYVKLIKQYMACNSNIKYEIVNETTHYDIMTEYGLGLYNEMLVLANGKDVLMYPDYSFTSVDYTNNITTDITEQSITNAILKVTDKDPAKVYFVTGHGEFDESEISVLISLLDSSVYEYEFINLLSTPNIPEDCDILAILAPNNDYSAPEAELIKTYINNGGNILLGMSTIDNDTTFTNLQTILDLYAVTIEDGVLYEGTANYYASIQGTAIPIILLPEYSSSTITESISLLSIFPWAQAVTVDYDKSVEMNVTYEDLIYTSNNAYITSPESNFNIEGLKSNTYALATKVVKKIETEGEDEKTSSLIVVGHDTFLADTDSYLGSSLMVYNEYVGNIEFVANCFEDLAEKENSLVISKNIDSSTFIPTAQETKVVQFILIIVPVVIILAGIIVGAVRKRMR